ncbi:MAG TPA: sigma 54-interacting transcriptional regulator [Candidatus Sulfotelmatobacter sp.]|nr:sigma 54-interacting transcriptional regulator [Candidatus Sulfotelmatobacter sp.]
MNSDRQDARPIEECIALSAKWSTRKTSQNYALAFVGIALAAFIRYRLDLALGFTQPFVLFYPVITMAALLGGFGPGIFATALSSVASAFLFLEPLNSLRVSALRDLIGLSLFVLMGVAISAICAQFRGRAHRLLDFQKAFEGLEEMIAVVDRRGRFILANHAFLNYWDIERRDLIGRGPDTLFPATLATALQEKLGDCLQGRVVQFEVRCSHPSRGERDLFVSHLPVEGPSGIDRSVVVVQDLTDEKQTQAALRESEQRERLRAQELQTLLDTLPIPVLIAHDPDCERVTANLTGQEFLGVGPDTNISASAPFGQAKPFRFFRNELEVGPDQLPMQMAAATGSPVDDVATKIVLEDGTETYELGNAAPLFDPSGRVRGAIYASVDITSRIRAEEALRDREQHFRALVEQASDGIFISDAQGRYIDVNSAGAEMLGYTREEVLQRSIADVIIPEDVPRIPVEVARFAGGATVRSDWTFRRKDGSCFPGEVCGKQLPDGRLQGIVRDMTERKLAEEDMRRREERFRIALKDSPIFVFNQDRDLRFTWVYNSQLYRPEEMIGKTDEELPGSKGAKRLLQLKREVLETGNPVREEVAVNAHGRSYAYDLTIEPLFDADRNIIGITGAGVNIAKLRAMADSLQEAHDKLAQEKQYLENEIEQELGFEDMKGRSSQLKQVLAKARIVAPTDSTVLLLGETGTGKELVARSVHRLSARRDRTFVKLNCAAVPSGLLESELFGHEKGAFTGAVSQKLGRLELADKGTLFLDEIGEMPLELQPKLLRVLQDREFERLGSVRTLHVDVRIVAATNRDLRQDIADKKFREDLFYRLNVFPIELPPLRERLGDIPVLVEYFVQKYIARMGKHIVTIPDETLKILINWNWPGNVRELENVIERMVIMTKGRILAPPPAELQAPPDASYDSLTIMEREHIIRVLRETNGVLSGSEGAASRLGLKRTTLQSMLKRFNIQLQDYRRGGNGGAYRA